MMIKKQRGISLSGMLIWASVVTLIILLGMKLVPTYIEYVSIKRILNTMAIDPDLQVAHPSEIRQAFDKYAAIDNIKTVSGRNLEISKERGQKILEVSYSVKTHLFANVSLYMDFTATSDQ